MPQVSTFPGPKAAASLRPRGLVTNCDRFLPLPPKPTWSKRGRWIIDAGTRSLHLAQPHSAAAMRIELKGLQAENLEVAEAQRAQREALRAMRPIWLVWGSPMLAFPIGTFFI